MRSISITTNYDQTTRILETDVTLAGFVPGMPDQLIVKKQIDTVTLFASTAITSSDVNLIQVSQARALLACTKDVADWLAAARLKSKSDSLPDPLNDTPDNTLPYDPDAQFNTSLNKT